VGGKSKLHFCAPVLNDQVLQERVGSMWMCQLKAIIKTQSTKPVYPKDQILLSHRLLLCWLQQCCSSSFREEFQRLWPRRTCQSFESFCSKGRQNIFYWRAGFLLRLTQNLCL